MSLRTCRTMFAKEGRHCPTSVGGRRGEDICLYSLYRAAIALAALLVLACRATRVPNADTTSVAARESTMTASSTSTMLVAGDSLRLVEHPEILPAGFPLGAKQVQLRNPYEGDKNAVATGGKLFIAYNCLDCHGAEGSGAM